MAFLFTQVWIFYFKIFNFLNLLKPNINLILTLGSALFLQASYLKLQLSRSASFFSYSNVCLPALRIQLLHLLKHFNYGYNLPKNFKCFFFALTNISFFPAVEDYNFLLKELLLAVSDPYILLVIIFLVVVFFYNNKRTV
jgi:hypothetical protein